MAKSGMYVGLDIGTASVKVVVAEYVEGQMNIIGVGDAKSEGLDRGIVVDIEETVSSIQKAVKQAEMKSGIEIKEVAVGLPGNQVEVIPCEGMIAVNPDSQEIGVEDVYNVASASMVRSIPPEREIISIVPQSFKVDGFDGIKDPRGMVGVRLEMKGLLFTGPKTIVHNIETCVKRAGLEIDKMVITPLALVETILPNGEKEFGTTVIDMGAGQTTATVIYEDEMKFTHVEQEGGDNVTKDISLVLNTSMTNAEGLKNNYGYAYAKEASETEDFPVDVIGQNDPVMVTEHYLAEIIEAREAEIFEHMKHILSEIDALSLAGGIVLTGGAASIPGILDLATEIFDIDSSIRLHVPNHMGLRNPMFSSVLAIVEYTANLTDIDRIVNGKPVAPKATSKKETVATKKTEPTKQKTVDNSYYEQPKEEKKKEEEQPEEEKTSRFKNFFDNIFE